MSRFTLGIAAFLFLYLLGTAIWQAPPDLNVYSVTFCDLIHESRRYDKKLVQVQVVYDSGVDTSTLSDSTCDVDKAWIRPTCSTSEVCDKMNETIKKIRQEAGNPWEGKVRLDVVGRYYASTFDPARNQRLRKVRTLEITEIKDAKFVGESNGP